MYRQKVNKILDLLEGEYPEAECALDHKNPFELIVAVALSAQTTDKSVNKVTPQLFKEYPDAFSLANASEEEVSKILKTIGMYRTKARNIINMSKQLVELHQGQVPEDYEQLVALSGVGRKTANVVRSVGFGIPAIAVDTHVFRVANRIGFAHESDVLKTEMVLMKTIPKKRWSKTHHSLIFHGRNCCIARGPRCQNCVIEKLCEKNF